MHRPRNRIGLLLSVVGVCAGAIFVGQWAALTHFHKPWSPYVEAVLTAAVVVQFWALLSLLFLFPSGSPTTTRAGWLYGTLTCWASVMLVLGVIRPGPLDLTGRENPLGVGLAHLRTGFELSVIGIAVGALLGVTLLAVRFRTADVVERAQLKWFMSASSLVVVLVALITFGPATGHADPLVGALEFAIVVAGYWALPAAIVVAILRYRLYDIDRLVSRSVTYTVVVGVLAAVYAGGVFLLPQWLSVQGDVAVAASTLAAAALFNPLRRRVQLMVDRRFNRPHFDGEREVERFASGLRDKVDLDDLTTALLDVAVTTLQPSGASVWIRTHDDA